MKALIVKEDGLIYAAEVPEEPVMGICSSEPTPNCYEQPNCICAKEWKPYKAAIASAKESAVLCADQKKAEMLIVGDYISRRPNDAWMGLQPGIYPIPDLQWEVKEELIYAANPPEFTPRDLYKQVAILKESTPSTEQETQEDKRYTLSEMYDFVQWYSGMDRLKIMAAYTRYLRELNKSKP